MRAVGVQVASRDYVVLSLALVDLVDHVEVCHVARLVQVVVDEAVMCRCGLERPLVELALNLLSVAHSTSLSCLTWTSLLTV